MRPFIAPPAAGSPSVGPRSLVSKDGASGVLPRWRVDSKELFFTGMDRTLMAVEIAAGPEFRAGVPKPLFQLPPNALAGDVTPDGKRFLYAVRAGETASEPYTVVLNWQSALKK